MNNYEEKDMVNVKFSYTDTFGETTQLDKTVHDDYMGGTQIEVINDLFHDFLLSCGFTFLANKRVEWVNDER